MTNNKKYERPNPQQLQSMVDKEPVNAKNDKCTRCGKCCTHHIGMFPHEIDRIRQYIQDHNIKPCVKNTPPAEQKDALVVDMCCPFLDTTNPETKCTIYDVRPWICKHYICSHRNDPEYARKVLMQEFRSKNSDFNNMPFKDFMKLDIKEWNMQQIFFPETYTPEPGDLVVINQLHINEYLKYRNLRFLMTDTKRQTNGITEILLMNPIKQIWFDIQGLCKVYNVN